MSGVSKLRVAAVQYHAGTDLQANLEKTLCMLDRAAEVKPDLVVLPEFCNHLSWYDDKQHCFDVSVSLQGEFLQAVAQKAKELKVYVVINCTVQREGGSATGSSLMYSPSGELVADNTKQIYIGHENDFLETAKEPGPIVDLPFGRVGFYACMDGVINETPRCLSLRGAQILCNSLNSFASDEASLHIPVRAAENKVFVVAANKVGPLVPEHMVDAISTATGIPPRFLGGAGESQIVAPDGTVLAMASLDKEEVIYADIDAADALVKQRVDGTNIFSARRPELYKAISDNPAEQPLMVSSGVVELPAAVLTLEGVGKEALASAEASLAALGDDVQWVALPPLLGAADISKDVTAAVSFSEQALVELQALAAKHQVYLSTSLALNNTEGVAQYSAVLIAAEGVILRQGQVHFSQRFFWSALSDEVATLDLPVGRVGLLVSDDSVYPEMFRLLAMAGVEVAAVALDPLESWELSTGLLERSAENRINLLVSALHEDLGASFATVLQNDFTVMTEWKERPFDGLLSQPEFHQMPAGERMLTVVLHPAAALNKEVSRNTNLLNDRPWQLSSAISDLC